MKTRLCILFLIIFLISCSKSTRLETSLRLAGDNRSELEKVLEAFSVNKADSLKYRAACFLIENMTYHYSYTGEDLNVFFSNITPLVHHADSKSLHITIATLDSLQYLLQNKNKVILDIQNIDADFLISHINKMFLTREYPWAKDVSFEDFCEYVLPYRVRNEPIEDWVPKYTEFAKEIADSLYQETTSFKDFIVALTNNFNEKIEYVNSYNFNIDLPPSLILGIRYGTCKELAFMTLYTFKALGIPVSWDSTLNWANRSLGHDWIGIVVDGEYYPFLFQDSCEFGEHLTSKPQEKYSKIYRRTYSLQNHSLVMQKIDESIPEKFINPYLKDVSYIYQGEFTDLIFPLKTNEIKKQILYTMVFNDKECVAIGWSKIKDDKAILGNTRKDCCYLICFYDKGKFIPVSKPFVVNKEGVTRELSPNFELRQKLILYRKYPMKQHMQKYANRSIGGEFHSSNNRNFNNYEILYRVEHSLLDMKWHKVSVSPQKKFNYLRYYSAKGGYNNIAEIKFISSDKKEIRGEIIGSGELLDDRFHLKEMAFDDNPLTFFDAEDPDNSWVGLAISAEEDLKEIQYIFRNDDNNIRIGDDYELFYWDNDMWNSLGFQKASNDFLEYNNCPTNTLFLLKNYSRGKEERIFTYENDEQIWW